MAKSYNNAVIYQKQGKHEEALEMYTKSLDITDPHPGWREPP